MSRVKQDSLRVYPAGDGEGVVHSVLNAIKSPRAILRYDGRLTPPQLCPIL